MPASFRDIRKEVTEIYGWLLESSEITLRPSDAQREALNSLERAGKVSVTRDRHLVHVRKHPMWVREGEGK